MATRHIRPAPPTLHREVRANDLAANELRHGHRVTVTEGAFLFVFAVFVFMLMTVAVVA